MIKQKSPRCFTPLEILSSMVSLLGLNQKFLTGFTNQGDFCILYFMKYFIKTFGCQQNESDSERIAAFLERKGYKSAENMEGADLIVVNACSVRQSAIDRILGLKPKIRKLKILNPKSKFILTGCVLRSDKKKFEEFFDLILNIKDLPKLLSKKLYPIFRDREKKGIKICKDYLEIRPKHLYGESVFVPIITGCDNYCTYCVVPYTRGRESSRPVKEIIKEVKDLIKKGYKEITLLGQNVNSYQYGFAKLLKKLNSLPGNFKIHFLTSHPKDMSDELVETIANCKKIAKEIHLPIQSGDDGILKKMNRGYTVKQYKNLVKKIRRACRQAGKKNPNVKLSTDVIVGFPGETKKQFENTVKVFKEIKFDKAYINKYSPRAGTAAVKLKDNVPWEEKKRRWAILNEIVNPPADRPKLIVVVGPTASGKSELAVKIAKQFNGEIISADSRQVYRGMDIGTGKITPDTKNSSNFGTGQAKKKYIFTHKGIPHYMLDIASPKRQFTVAQYKQKALKAINGIYRKNKIPIICGGTGFYIQAVVVGLVIPKVRPDWKLRKKLEKKTVQELFSQLKKLDPHRAKNIDSKNKRRLIRALEIIIKTGEPVPPPRFSAQGSPRGGAGEPASGWDVLYIGIKKPMQELKELIRNRLLRRLKKGMIAEIRKLRRSGISWKRLDDFGLEYRYVARHLQGKLNKQEMFERLQKEIEHYAKRQMTWFKKNKRIYWIENFKDAEKLVKEFLLKI